MKASKPAETRLQPPTPICLINPTAGSGRFTACLLRDGIFWAAKVEPKIVQKAGGWLDKWNANALSIKLERIQRITGELESSDMRLVCTDDAGQRHDIDLTLASKAQRDLLRDALLAQLGDWPVTETPTPRSKVVLTGFVWSVGCLLLAWAAAEFSDRTMPRGLYDPRVHHAMRHQMESKVLWFLSGLTLSMVNRFGLSLGWLRWVAVALVILAVIIPVWSFYMEGAIHFEHRRPPQP